MLQTRTNAQDGHVLPYPGLVRRLARYPLRRGLTGHLFYHIGMGVTRLIIRLRAEGLDNIPRRAPYVIAANHETYVDGLWISSFLPKAHFRRMSCIAAKEFENRHGILGRIIIRVGRAIPIDRFGNPIRGLIIARKAVEAGNIMLVHPEGTRSPDGKLGEMKDGAAFIAMKSHVPLLPVFLDGGYEVFNRHMRVPQGWNPITRKKREVVLTFGAPMDPANFSSARDMTQALSEWMHTRFRQKKSNRLYLPDSANIR